MANYIVLNESILIFYDIFMIFIGILDVMFNLMLINKNKLFLIYHIPF